MHRFHGVIPRRGGTRSGRRVLRCAFGLVSRRWAAAGGACLLLVSVAAFGASQVQRCTDKDGKVTFSDRPCQNEAAQAVPVPPRAVARTEPKAGVVSYAQDAGAFRDLQGSWSTSNVSQNGKLLLDRELMSRTWIFRTDDLYIESDAARKKPRHFTVEVDRGAQPAAIRVTASSAADRDGWLIYARERDQLKIAFYPDFQRRPAGFDSGDGLLVLRLTPRSESAPDSASDGCGILRAAGAYELIGTGKGQQRSRQDGAGGFECRVWRDHSVHLLVSAARAADFDRRLKESRLLKDYEVKEEPGVGGRAYSTRLESNVSFVAFKDGKIVQLNFIVRAADVAQLRQVFGRVLEQI